MNKEETVYISLQEATQRCSYSQEYLSLRARQGKLKAIKFGRNWVTKKEWLEEYLQHIEEHNNNLNNKKVILPPENLPVEPAPSLLSVMKFFTTGIRFEFVMVLVFVAFITGAFHNKGSFYSFYETANPLVVELNDDFDKGVVDLVINTVSEIPQSFQFVVKESSTLFSTFASFGGSVSEEIDSRLAMAGYQAASVGEGTVEIFQEYFQWLGHQFSGMAQKIVQSYVKANDQLEEGIAQDADDIVKGYQLLVSNIQKEVTDFARIVDRAYRFAIRPWQEVPGEMLIVEKPVRPQPEEGAVIVPYPEEKIAEVKGKLEKAFSDKVEVTPDETGRAGKIVPIIEKAEAQEYLYLLVPVNEQ